MVEPSIQAAENFKVCQKYPQERPSAVEGCSDERGPEVYTMDVGQWLGNPSGWFVGMVSGSHMLIVRLMAQSVSVPKCSPTIDAALVSLDARGLSPFVLHHKIAAPWSEEEIARSDEVLMSKDDVLVLIPDCHVGLRDCGDMFSKDKTLESCDLLLSTVRALRDALGDRVRIVQLGDFLEVWETEAKPGIYFTEGLEGAERTHLRPRRERAEMAISEVKRGWGGTPLEDATGLFDMMLLGNHDVEMRWTVSQFYGLGKQTICDRVRTGRGGCIVFEHGHCLDKYNDTRPADCVHDVLPKVDGKGKTYEYARNKRGRRWAEPSPKDPADSDWWPAWVQQVGAIDWLGDYGIGKSAREYDKQVLREAYHANGFLLKRGSRSAGYVVPVRLWIHAHTHTPSLHEFSLDVREWERLQGWFGRTSMDRKPSLLDGASDVYHWQDLLL